MSLGQWVALILVGWGVVIVVMLWFGHRANTRLRGKHAERVVDQRGEESAGDGEA